MSSARSRAAHHAERVREALHGYLHVKQVATALPAHFSLDTSRKVFIEHVAAAPIVKLETAWFRPRYLAYLQNLPEDHWLVHLKGALAIRDARAQPAAP